LGIPTRMEEDEGNRMPELGNILLLYYLRVAKQLTTNTPKLKLSKQRKPKQNTEPTKNLYNRDSHSRPTKHHNKNQKDSTYKISNQKQTKQQPIGSQRSKKTKKKAHDQQEARYLHQQR
jgi:hypothetical protein